MEFNNSKNVISVKIEPIFDSEMENSGCLTKDQDTDSLTVFIKKEPVDNIEIEVPMLKTEFEVPITNPDINIPIIKTENIEQPDSFETNSVQNLSQPICIVSDVASLKVDKESYSECTELHSESSSANVDSELPEDNFLTEESKQQDCLVEMQTVSWEISKEFKNIRDVHNYLKREKCWYFTQQCFGNDGLKNYYKCSKGIKNGPPCPAQMFLLFHTILRKVVMYNTSCHIHVPVYGMTDKIKLEINRLYALKLKPAAILSNLAEVEGIPLPTYAQIKAYLRTERNHRKKKQTNIQNTTIDSEKQEVDEAQKSDDTAPSTSVSPEQKRKRKGETVYSSEDEEISSLLDVQRKRQRKTMTWEFSKEFDTEQAAQDYISNEKIWSFVQRHQRKQGMKLYYRCNQVALRGPQCPARVYLYLHAPSGKVLLYHTQAKHKHDPQNLTKYPLSDKVKEEIEKLHNQGHKPQSILENLAKIEGIEVPRRSQLKWYLYYIRNNHKSTKPK